jgi:hypothetical protein
VPGVLVVPAVARVCAVSGVYRGRWMRRDRLMMVMRVRIGGRMRELGVAVLGDHG